VNVQEIYDFLSKNTEGGKLNLASSTIVGGAQRALDTFFGGRLELAGVAITKESDRVVARGVGIGAPFDALDVSASFFDDGGRVGAEMTANAKGDWRFTRAFPALSGTFLDRATVSDGALTIARSRGGTIDGALTAGYAKDGGTVALGRGFFHARPDGRAYIAGFAAPGTFSPGSIWSALAPLFDILQFSDSGILYSSVEAERTDFSELVQPSVPDTIQPGVTFFTTLRLGGALDILALLLGRSRTLNLRGVIDVANPVNSTIEAAIPGDINLHALRFEDLVLVMRPGATDFSIAAKAILTVAGSSVALDGGGTINVAARSARLNIIIPQWRNALGISRLSISEFGLGIGVDTAGVTTDFLGHFEIGRGKTVRFQLGGKVVDFAEPVALTFALDKPDPANPLKLSDIIEAFTSLDLGSVPLIKDIAFRDLAFYAIADPSGQWTAPPTKPGVPPVTFKNGIGLRADLRIFDWDLEGSIAVDERRGINASGKIVQPISILGLLRISARSDRSIGPSFSIDTTKLAPRASHVPQVRLLEADDAYFSFDGEVSLLGITSGFQGAARESGFNVNFGTDLLGLFHADFRADYDKGKSFHGSATGGFNLNLTLPALKVAGVTIIPATTINGPTASLSLSVAVSSSEANVGVRLKFAWLGADFDVSFTLDAMKIVNLLANLWEEIKRWILSNLEEFYKAILSSAQKFIDAIKNGALWVADQAKEIANALKSYYNYTADQVSRALKEIGCAVDAVVKAVAAAFSLAYDEAARIVNDAAKTCALGMTEAFINA
jgi:hypothetical protein